MKPTSTQNHLLHHTVMLNTDRFSESCHQENNLHNRTFQNKYTDNFEKENPEMRRFPDKRTSLSFYRTYKFTEFKYLYKFNSLFCKLTLYMTVISQYKSLTFQHWTHHCHYFDTRHFNTQ